MADEKAKPRRRRWPFVLLALALLAGIGALVLRHYTRPEKLTALLVDQVRSQFGLGLALDGSAGFRFLPTLRLRLPKPQAKFGDDTLLGAAAIDVAMPWRSLWGERVEIERIEIDHPQLDLDALSSWLAARPAGGATPDVRFAVRVREGTLLASGEPLSEGVNLDFANAGDLAAWFARALEPDSALLPPLAGEASARSVRIGGTRIEGLRVEVRDEEAPPQR